MVDKPMILSKTKLKVPKKIKKLLVKYNLGVIFLGDKEFSYMLNCWKDNPDAIAISLMHVNLIIINEGRIREEAYSQRELNYILLHEYGHISRQHWTEKDAHTVALRTARYYNIPIDYSRIILEENL